MITRRGFLGAGLASGLPFVFPRDSWAQPLARRPRPWEELRVAVVGIRSRGRNHIDGYRALPGVRVAALCDVDQSLLAREADRFAERGEQVDTVGDVRRLLERDDIHAISIATPNHWHALLTVWACQAGKDVYVEKPVSHNVWEGRQMVRAARKYGRIVQTGTQSRSSYAIAEAISWLHEGHLGAIELATGLCYKPRQSIGKVSAPTTIPEGVDYELWCGPAPKGPLMREQLHYDWHWVTETGNGDLGNQGVHQMDLCRWALGETTAAPFVQSVGGRLGYDDDGNTPNTQVIYHGYEKAPLVFEVRGLPRDKKAQEEDWRGRMDSHLGARIGVIIKCEKGLLRIPNYTSAVALDGEGKEVKSWQGAHDHYANFISAVTSRKASELSADIEVGHVSASLCHYGAISHALGRAAAPETIQEALGGRAPAAEASQRMLAHLEANGVDLAATPLTLGVPLQIDAAAESIKGSPRASELLRRDYREPFVVPAI
ncbi:MAG: dehydrogenase [Planctomycetes bacterium]|jgi:predicted dehydrogenase|nr:dehydrogenase [Planctomycetota bacterium]HJO25724.1 Gfo/Idh/MocA family oxidoreductase [Planctomycetota bacterium]